MQTALHVFGKCQLEDCVTRRGWVLEDVTIAAVADISLASALRGAAAAGVVAMEVAFSTDTNIFCRWKTGLEKS